MEVKPRLISSDIDIQNNDDLLNEIIENRNYIIELYNLFNKLKENEK